MGTPVQDDIRQYAAATAHRDAHPAKKRAALANGVTDRTERRWGTAADAKGSPLDRWLAYLEVSQDPYRLEVRAKVQRLMVRRVRKLTRDEVIERVRELHAENALQEGIDNANRARRGMRWMDRAADCERDARHEIELAALYQRCEELKITEDEVFGV